MKNKFILLSAMFTLSGLATLFGQANIADARSQAIGSTVTISGVSADGGELGGSIRYIQDQTGGIPIYGYNTVNGVVNRGDSVEVTGVLKLFNGLLEIDPITNFVAHGQGTEIDPWLLNVTDLGNNYEGRLIQLDNVTFNDAGASFTNGSNFVISDGSNTTEVRINAGTNLAGTTIPSGAQTVVGLLSEFSGTFQLLVRDAADIFPYVAPDKKIQVLVDGTNELNGATVNMGTSASIPLVLENIGTNDLTISSINFTGPAAAEYSTTLSTGIISGGANISGTIDFSPAGTGSRIADLEIVSNDPDNPTYIITLYGIGTDGLASEPTNGATNLSFSNIEAYGMKVSYDMATDADGYLVVWNKGSMPTGEPVDGTSYLRGDMIGSDKIAYVGSNASFAPRGIRANIDYYYKVYAFNGYGTHVNYNQTDDLQGNQMSGGSQIGSYYGSISSSDPNLVNDLTALINPHDFSSYYMYKLKMMDGFEAMDTTGGESFVVGVYTGERAVYNGTFEWNDVGFSREHTYPKSWFGSGSTDQNDPEYSDYHNLYPVNQNMANQPRSNLPLGEVVGTPSFEYLDGKRGENVNGVLVYEPRDAQKGNAARAMFYMATAYNGPNGTGDDWSLPAAQNQDVLKQWHFQDLPDSYEIARHEKVFSIQNNRNPYIDSVNFACYVDFSDMTYHINGCDDLGLTTDYIENNLSVFPNPSNDKVYVQLNGVDISAIEVKDISGRTVGSYTFSKKYAVINVDTLRSGTYFFNIHTEKGNIVRKVVVQ